MSLLASPALQTEQYLILEGISWQRFEDLSACFAETTSIRLTYLQGLVEIMSPFGEAHETYKKSIGYLLEAYFDIKGIRFYGRGGFTLKKIGVAAGEPDESYCIGSNKNVPDLVIEVVVSSGALSKLPLYHAKGIPEVWIWQAGQLHLYVLNKNNYSPAKTSQLLPDLDIKQFVAHIEMPDQYDAVQAFRRTLMQSH